MGLLYSRGNYAQYFVTTYMGKEFGKERVCMCVYLNYFAVHLQLRQHCKSAILQ